MPRPKTELEQRCPSPPYTRWDQRGKPVLLVHLKKEHFLNEKPLHLSLQTKDPDIAKRHMRWLVGMLLLQRRLRADSGAAKEYGPKGNSRPRWLVVVETKVRRLKALSEVEYGSEALAAAKRWGRPEGFIHYLAERKPELGAAAYRQRHWRARKRAQQRGDRGTPARTSWHFRRQGGKYFYSDHAVMHARIQLDGRVYQWSLGARDRKAAARAMGPIRLAREGVCKAADEWGAFELGTNVSIGAGARCRLRVDNSDRRFTFAAPRRSLWRWRRSRLRRLELPRCCR
jgi:hypothetical protein